VDVKGSPYITLLLGGAGSGKSELAERMSAAQRGPVTYIATAVLDDQRPDAAFAARIEAHRRRRPAEWRTVEAGAGLVEALAREPGGVLVDALGTWVAATPEFDVDISGLCTVLRSRSATTVVVSDEVGLGVHPSTEVGGRFRDVLGAVNKAVAEVAGNVLLVVAGRVLPLGRPVLPAPVGEG
jgi:adenosyl cobinamide kinase/adenosyl cobinamide phosphate guanylyltransferase